MHFILFEMLFLQRNDLFRWIFLYLDTLLLIRITVFNVEVKADSDRELFLRQQCGKLHIETKKAHCISLNSIVSQNDMI